MLGIEDTSAIEDKQEARTDRDWEFEDTSAVEGGQAPGQYLGKKSELGDNIEWI